MSAFRKRSPACFDNFDDDLVQARPAHRDSLDRRAMSVVQTCSERLMHVRLKRLRPVQTLSNHDSQTEQSESVIDLLAARTLFRLHIGCGVPATIPCESASHRRHVSSQSETESHSIDRFFQQMFRL